MDVISGEDVADSAGDVLDRQIKDELFCHQIDDIVKIGKYPEQMPDFRHANDAIYPVDNDNLQDVIGALGMKYTFQNLFNLNWLDVSGVTDMNNLFAVVREKTLNVNISRWDTSNVENMDNMFNGKHFNNNISRWDVSSVRTMECMFYLSTFTGDISGWDIRSLRSCQYMFANSNFNRDISAWDVSHIYNMDRMFYGSKMIRNLSNWDVTNVQYKYEMFIGTPMMGKFKWYPKGCRS